MRFKGARLILLIWAISFLVALGTRHDLFYKLTYFLSALIVLSLLWTWLSVRGTRLERQTRAKRSQVGRSVEERFTVYNTALLPKLWLEVRDHSDLPAHRASCVVSALGWRGRRSWTVRTTCWRRGRFTLGPITLTSGDPFGLFTMWRQFPLTSTLIVYPAIVDLPTFTTPVGQLLGGSVMHRRTHYVTPNVSGVRDYVPGDGFNRIHWPSTAHTGRLIVKEFELEPTAAIWLFLDMDGGVQAGWPWVSFPEREGPALLWTSRPRLELEPTTEEYGVTVAASLAKHFIDRQRDVGLVAYGGHRVVIQPDRGERQLIKILGTLALIRAKGRIPLAEVVAAEGLHCSRNTTVVVITPSTEGDWVSALRYLERRGVQVIVVLLIASTFGLAASSREVQAELAASAITTYLVRGGEPVETAFSQGGGIDHS